jgi:hypothetical protein
MRFSKEAKAYIKERQQKDFTEMPRFISSHKMINELAHAAKKYILYFSFDADAGTTNILKAIPFLDAWKHIQIISDGCGYIMFDTLEELQPYYDQLECDHPADGKIPVYALTCWPDGVSGTENT